MASIISTITTSGILLVILQLSTHRVSCQKPEIVNYMYPEIQRIGGTARLNCTIAKLGVNSVHWTFYGPGGFSQPISINEKIQILEGDVFIGGKATYKVVRKRDELADRTTFMLVINRLQKLYSGKYTCSIVVTGENNLSQYTSKSVNLTVQYPPVIEPGTTDTVVQIEQGKGFNLKCNASGVPAPNVTWVRSDGKLLPTGRAIHRGSVLPITSADVKYSGIYRCVADNQIRPPAQSLTQVYIFQRPVVRVIQDTVGQYANGMLSAKLDCIVQGYPAPTVYWYFYDGDKKIKALDADKYDTTKQATDYQNLYNGEQWYTLLIRYVQAGDFKDYFCLAENKEGTGQARVTLFSTYDCQGPLCYSLQAETRDGAGITQLSPLLCLLATIVMLLRII